jgi:hypothetical protein
MRVPQGRAGPIARGAAFPDEPGQLSRARSPVFAVEARIPFCARMLRRAVA